jgi:hypothetical protein
VAGAHGLDVRSAASAPNIMCKMPLGDVSMIGPVFAYRADARRPGSLPNVRSRSWLESLVKRKSLLSEGPTAGAGEAHAGRGYAHRHRGGLRPAAHLIFDLRPV